MITHLMVKNNMSKEDATAAVDTLLEGMRSAILRGEAVVLMNVGTIYSKPQTKTSRISFGKEIQIKREIKTSFRVSKNLEITPETSSQKNASSSIAERLKELE